MKSILEFLVILLIIILPQMMYAWYAREFIYSINRFSNQSKLISSSISHTGNILLIVYIAFNQTNGLSSVGLSLNQAEIPKIVFVSVVATGYLSLLFISGKFRSRRIQEESETRQRQTFEILGFSTFKTSLEKFFSLINLWLSIFAEELTYRGYLILLMGTRTGTFVPWILMSITLSVVIHLYQGRSWRTIYAHAFLATVFVIIVMTTKNIVAAFIPHLIYDTIWMLRRWAVLAKEETKQPEPIV